MTTSSYAWLLPAALTAILWAAFGLGLSVGQRAMSAPAHALSAVLLFVGIAYGGICVGYALLRSPTGSLVEGLTPGGIGWALATGAFGAAAVPLLLHALSQTVSAAAVLVVAYAVTPVASWLLVVLYEQQLGAVRWPFVVGLLLIALGVALIVFFQPRNVPLPSRVLQ